MKRYGIAVALVVGALANSAGVGQAIVGGTTIQIQQAPWAVYIVRSLPGQSAVCSGTIIDASNILTAGHCAVDSSGAPVAPSAFTVYAGLSDASGQMGVGGDSDAQMASVSGVRVHPSFIWTGQAVADDVAVLTLSAPLSLDASAQAATLPASGSPYPAGVSANDAGYGQENPNAELDGSLNEIALTVDPQGQCGGANSVVPSGSAVAFCASSTSGTICSGDSGSGLVNSAGVVIGVADAGPPGCAAGSHGIFTYVDAPEILDFIMGSSPPSAPRQTAGSYVALEWYPPLEVGATLICDPGSFSGQPTLSYAFANAATGQVVKQGTQADFVLTAADAGQTFQCTVSATNAGGTTVLQSGITPAIAAATGTPPAKTGSTPSSTAKPKAGKTIPVSPVKPVSPSVTTTGAASAAATYLGQLSELHAKGIAVQCVPASQLRTLARVKAGTSPSGFATAHAKKIYLDAHAVCTPLKKLGAGAPDDTETGALLAIAREYGTILGLRTGPSVECYAARTTWKWVERGEFGTAVTSRVRTYLLAKSHHPSGYALAATCKLS